MEEILVYLSVVHGGDWNKIYKDILDKKSVDKNDVDEVISSLKFKYITLLDSRYPSCLKSIFKPPFVLFYEGDISLINDTNRRIAVIGSRDNSKYGEESAFRITKGLCKQKVIVSGLAKGIDSIAHSSCLEEGGKTIAVLGNGIDIIYPKENELLYNKIKENGLILSEYPSGTMPDSANFPTRNRIISGLSDGIVVIEAKEKSGTMNTVAHALEDGKQIFCVPERCNLGSGCNKLIKEGAKLIENEFDILDDLV